MSWTRHSIDDVKRAVRLDELIAEHTPLRKDGGGLIGRCCMPGHDDQTPSLAVDLKKQLWFCHGCGQGGGAVDFVMKHAGVGFRDAMLQLAARTGITLVDDDSDGAVPRVVATWDYHDDDGVPLYRVKRWEPGRARDGKANGRSKSFSQLLADGRPGRSDRQVLYRLVEVTDGIRRGVTVHVVEGEKVADALRALGLCATTHAGGTGAVRETWSTSFAAQLAGAHVVLLPDNDVVGIEAMQHIGLVLASVAASVVTVRLPVHGKGDDAVEWLAEGGSARALETLITAARGSMSSMSMPSSMSALPTSSASSPGEDHLTDSGNAERWVRLHGDRFRFDASAGRWLAWDGRRWVKDSGGAALLSTKDVARSWLKDVESAVDSKRRVELVKHANASESLGRREAMLVLAKSEAQIMVTAPQLDSDPWLLNVENGTIDLRSGQLRAHRREDLCTKLAPVVFDERAASPTFDAFLASSLPDVEVRGFVQRFLGYSLTGVVREHVLPIFYGSGGNGKGTLIEAVKAVLGEYAQAVPAELLMQRKGESHPTELATLLGLRLAFASETDRGAALSEKTIKSLTGADTISARFMRQDFFNFEPTHKLVLQTNHKPVVKGTDHGVWRRLRLVPFTVVPRQPDLLLKEKLAHERAGILRWLVAGCQTWCRDGLGNADAIDAATAEYRNDSDLLGEFLSDCCLLVDGARTSASQLYREYRSWGEARGEHLWTQTAFGRQMSDRGLRSVKAHGNKVYVGLGLRLGDGAHGLSTPPGMLQDRSSIERRPALASRAEPAEPSPSSTTIPRLPGFELDSSFDVLDNWGGDR